MLHKVLKCSRYNKENKVGGDVAMMRIITFKDRSVPVYFKQEGTASVELLHHKLYEMELDFSFRKKWKRIKSVEMVRDVAIFQYNDGTKLYLEVS